MPNPGDVNIVAGVYACADCGKQISVAKGRTSPRCLVCVKTLVYDLLAPTE
jgi:DNA-directed RNA polymerase subunit RPC12/RpoP